MLTPVLSHYTVEPLLRAREAEDVQTSFSLDLSLSTVEVKLDDEGVLLPDDIRLSWEQVEHVAADDVGCYALDPDGLRKIQTFSETTQRAISLMPTAGAPTMLVAGFPMHRIKDTDPHKDTLAKIKTIAPFTGRTLDTNTGLGYTAIQAARTAASVVTVDIDPAVLEIAAQNPWSRELFSNPRIERITGDSFDVVETQPDGAFSRIVHDPPTMQLAGDLYSLDFYRELFRVLAKGGRLFHYIGDPNSAQGAKLTPGIMTRLEKAGFTRVQRRPEAFGVSAVKP